MGRGGGVDLHPSLSSVISAVSEQSTWSCTKHTHHQPITINYYFWINPQISGNRLPTLFICDWRNFSALQAILLLGLLLQALLHSFRVLIYFIGFVTILIVSQYSVVIE